MRGDRRSSVSWATLALVAGAISSSCATNPATGNRQIMLISEQQEIAMGRDGIASTR